MKRKLGLKILIAVEVIVLVLLLVWILWSRFAPGERPQIPTETSGQTLNTDDTEITEPETTVLLTENTVPAETAETSSEINFSEATQNTENHIPDVPVSPQKTNPAGITFPYAIEESGLVIEKISGYDGIFLEDGSDGEISGVAAILVKNTADQCVDYAEIFVQGDSADYSFKVSGLASGKSAIVMDMNKSAFVSQKYNSIAAETAYAGFFEMSESLIQVEELGEGKLRVSNVSDSDIPCVRLFYKFYMPEEDVYVGGITYTTKIINLKAGEAIEVIPSHYAAGSSKVIMVKTYQTAD